MPFYNHLENWSGLEIEAVPSSPWRKRFPFWPFFVGQMIQFELRVTKEGNFEKDDLKFHLVEKMTGEEKPKIVTLTQIRDSSTTKRIVFCLQNGSKVTSKGDVRYWLSNRGYIVENEPIFTAEAISLDSLIIPALFALLGPLFGFIVGLILGLILGA